ncbi:MAG: thioredoxin family protein, partial [Planctomycetota bacterium]
KPIWFDSYKAGISAAKAQKRPVLIKFEAEWCSWCKKMDREVFAQPQIIKALENYICIRIDVDKQRNVALAYKIKTLPRIIVVNKHDEIVGDWLGYRDSAEFSKLLKDVWEYTHAQTGTTRMPKVREDAAKPNQLFEAVKINRSDTNELISLLGHKNPGIRREVIDALVKDGLKAMPTVIPALESKYLGTRIAAWKVVGKLKGAQYKFDPWAPSDERAEALRKLKEQLGPSLPKPASQPAKTT